MTLFLRWLPLLLGLGLAVACLYLLRSESLRAYQNGFDAAKAECANRGLKAALASAETTITQQSKTFAQLSALADTAAQQQARLAHASHALSQEYTRYAQTRADAPCLDADGLRLLRAADANSSLHAVPSAAAQPDGPVPAAAGVGRPQPPRGGGPRAGEEPLVLPVQSQGSRFGPVGNGLLKKPWPTADPLMASPNHAALPRPLSNLSPTRGREAFKAPQ